MSPNDEGSQFSKLHFLCNKEERLVLNSFFREYNLYLKKKKTFNLFKVAYHPVSCLLHLHIIRQYVRKRDDKARTFLLHLIKKRQKNLCDFEELQELEDELSKDDNKYVNINLSNVNDLIDEIKKN